jgi:UDP-N-acetylmuramoylalanine--D-glutamate ligase
MAKNRLSGKKTAVIGLGREGIELVRFLIEQNALVTVLDGATRQKLGAKYLEAKKLGADFRLGGDYLKSLSDFDIVFRSPGISLLQKEFKQAVRKGVEMSSTTRLFFELCPAKTVGITGTKGKSTTTSLIYHLLKDKKKKVYLAGNIGHSPIPLLKKLKKTDVVVLELSSFQLEDLTKSPNISVLLNVVPEHLDRHKTMGKYLLAKQNIYKHQKKSDVLVASRDFGPTRIALQQAKGKTCPVSTKQILKKGIYLTDGEIIYRDIQAGRRQVVAKVAAVKLRGEHMLENVLPAIGAAILAGSPVKRIEGRLKTFKPLHHRLEVVRTIGKTVFVNDSLGTTPEAAAAAVLAYADVPKTLIIGGVHKGGDIKQLAKTVARSDVRLVMLIGQSAKKFEPIFKKLAPFVPRKTIVKFDEAIKTAYAKVKDGGAVMLVPACASFDMFKDAYDRGDQFTKIVKKL